jgi:hypothetical protein
MRRPRSPSRPRPKAKKGHLPRLDVPGGDLGRAFNTCELTFGCPRGARVATCEIDVETLLADNGDDGTADAVRQECADAVVHRCDSNTGFARGHSIAASLSCAPYFLLLSMDAPINAHAMNPCLGSLQRPPTLVRLQRFRYGGSWEWALLMGERCGEPTGQRRIGDVICLC